MDAMILTILIGAFVCGGVMLEALAPHLPALLGIEGRARGSRDGRAELERTMEELRVERDFYRALAEPAALQDDARANGGST